MSLSERDRQENITDALVLLVQALGSRTLQSFHIIPSESDYASIYSTTWDELIGNNFLESVQGFSDRYTFTPYGFRHALELMNMQGPLKEMLGRLCKYIKDSIERTQGTGVSVDTIAQTTRLTQSFIINAIDAQLIDYWLNRHGAGWVPDFGGVIV